MRKINLSPLSPYFESVASALGFGPASPSKLARLQEKIAKTKNELSEMEDVRKSLVDELKDKVEFEQILPGKKSRNLHKQLVANERVHPVDVNDLLQKRIGDRYANKRCFARVIRNGGDAAVSAGIFTALVEVPESNDHIKPQDIPGDISHIKNLDIEPFSASKGNVVAILYTISSSNEHNWEKGGRKLAANVYEYLHAEAKERGYALTISTLSPIREFASHLSKQDEFSRFFDNNKPTEKFFEYLKQSPDVIKTALMEYLLTKEGKERDPVMNFHLGNGAIIGDLKINENEPEDWIMVNYVYPSDANELIRNQTLYKSGNARPIAPHLLGYTKESTQKYLRIPDYIPAALDGPNI